MTDEVVYKVLLLGDSSVGKTFFLLLTFQTNKSIKLQIWDTAGKDRFRTITKNYYKGANGIILIYEVTNKQTFEKMKNWLKQIKEEANPNVIIYLAENKIDMDEELKIVPTEDGQIK